MQRAAQLSQPPSTQIFHDERHSQSGAEGYIDHRDLLHLQVIFEAPREAGADCAGIACRERSLRVCRHAPRDCGDASRSRAGAEHIFFNP
jgi:hypothetical protein